MKDHKFVLRLPPDLKRQAQSRARADSRSLNGYIVALIKKDIVSSSSLSGDSLSGDSLSGDSLSGDSLSGGPGGETLKNKNNKNENENKSENKL